MSREDGQGNLLLVLRRACTLEGAEVVELGAGTGRLTRLVAGRARSVRAYDGFPAMVEEGRRRVAAAGLANVAFAVASNDAIPEPDRSADLTLAGWTLGHCVGWYPASWTADVTKALREMLRITRPGGTLIVLETLGTGREPPEPPKPAVARAPVAPS